ncbi:MAG: hypothetical protein ACYDEB_06300 [Dehalococcoidia bacterium]
MPRTRLPRARPGVIDGFLRPRVRIGLRGGGSGGFERGQAAV